MRLNLQIYVMKTVLKLKLRSRRAVFVGVKSFVLSLSLHLFLRCDQFDFNKSYWQDFHTAPCMIMYALLCSYPLFV